MTEIIVALIGVLGAIAVAWITVKHSGSKKSQNNNATNDVIHGDKIIGDVVGRDKNEIHEHNYVEATKAENKTTVTYYFEMIFTFVFTFFVAAIVLGLFGALIGKALGGQNVGIAVGGMLAFIAGIANAGGVKRTKNLS